ncbi:selenocysteine lyase isoform X2 [Lemur catta]|uniref:selenocysteine lyase isoform X2 n=1 Tax=Lemur catta TaxID=9447 RepID=UPI001E26BA86|nr:selenocysteine lyase isoform X2 [Lemur catta]
MEAAAAPRREARGRAACPPDGCRKESSPERKVYMDYNATTPLEPEVIQAVTEAMQEAWGNPSSPYLAGRKAKDIINAARESLAKMVGGAPQDIIFTSGGTESNNLVIHSAVKHFHENQTSKGDTAARHSPVEGAKPHFITCTVEHDSIRLPLEHLAKEQVAAVTFVPVSKVSGRAEADDVLSAVRPATCLVSIMLANNETGVVMPIPEISQRVKALNQTRAAAGLPPILLHTDAAQALGKRRVDVEDLGVDFLTIVGHKDREHPNDCRPWEASDQGRGCCLRCCGSAAAIVRTAAARPVNVQSRSSCPSLQTHRTCPRIPPLSLHISPSCTLRPPRQAPLLQGHGCLSPCRAVAGMLSPPSHSPLCRPRPSTDPVGRSPSTSALVLVPLSLWGVGSSRVGTLAFPVLSGARRCLVNYRLHLSQRQKVLFMMLEGPAV